jgi:hypothetical protein
MSLKLSHAAQQRADRDNQDIDQGVILGAVDARIRQVFAIAFLTLRRFAFVEEWVKMIKPL